MSKKRRSVDRYDKRFCVIASEKGYIGPYDLIEVLTIQVQEDIENKPHRLLGEIFLNEDIMTPNQIEEVVKAFFDRKVDVKTGDEIEFMAIPSILKFHRNCFA
ncbi:MAG: hypothetical protein WAL98_12300 [Desulfatiglandaceae bacterium]|jgi:hypothetical protein